MLFEYVNNYLQLKNDMINTVFNMFVFILHSTGEFLSLAAMDTFLRSVQPEVNDLFVLSLVLINLLAWMDLFITQVLHSNSMILVQSGADSDPDSGFDSDPKSDPESDPDSGTDSGTNSNLVQNLIPTLVTTLIMTLEPTLLSG